MDGDLAFNRPYLAPPLTIAEIAGFIVCMAVAAGIGFILALGQI